MKESDNLVSLHAQIRECDTILTQMESLLGGFQVISWFIEVISVNLNAALAVSDDCIL